MNKKLLSAAALALAIATPVSAKDTNKYVPYVGADYGYISAKADSVKPKYHAFGVNVGTRYNRHFGTELFYQQTGSDSKKLDESSKFKSSYRAYGLDAAAYLPLDCINRYDLFATAGVGEYVFKKKFTGEKHHNDSGWGYRFGGGMMFNLDHHLSLRAMVRYVKLDGVSNFDHLVEYTAGIRYHF